MATLYVSEFSIPGNLVNIQSIGAVSQPSVNDQTVTFTTTTQSAAFKNNTNVVRIHTDGICSIAFGTNPTATTTNARMTAGSTEYFVVPQGQSFKVAAVTNT